jgi:hypothetical protein
MVHSGRKHREVSALSRVLDLLRPGSKGREHDIFQTDGEASVRGPTDKTRA